MDALQIPDQQPGMFNAVVYSAKERIFYGYPVSGDPLVVLHCLPQVIKRECLVYRHQCASQFVFSGVERDCKAYSQARCGKFMYARDYSGGRDGDMPDPKVSHAGVVQHPHRFQHSFGVEEGLSHTHVYDIAYVPLYSLLHGEELSRHLPGREVPYIT